MDESSAVTALTALAQASRLAVFRMLVAAGPDGMHAGELALQLGIPANTLSFHLKALTHAGLVMPEQQGRNVLYRASFSRMQALIDYLSDACCGGDVARCMPSRAVPTSKRKTA